MTKHKIKLWHNLNMNKQKPLPIVVLAIHDKFSTCLHNLLKFHGI